MSDTNIKVHPALKKIIEGSRYCDFCGHFVRGEYIRKIPYTDILGEKSLKYSCYSCHDSRVKAIMACENYD